MKKRGRYGLWACLLVAALCAGCGPAVESPTTTADAQLQSFESYVAQTSFSFPKSWEYQSDEEVDEGLQAIFTFDEGRAAVQFLWMDAQQQAQNVFLDQLDIDEVTETNCQDGAYSGKLVTGKDGSVHTAAFEGSRSWYDTDLMLVMRVLVQADTESVYLTQKRNLDALLASVEVQEDGEVPAVADEDFGTYDFMDTYGLSLSAPTYWDMRPQTGSDGAFAVSFVVAQGDNEVTVERGTLREEAYQEMLESFQDLGAYEDTYQFEIQQDGDVTTMTCIQEGKINRSTLTATRQGDEVSYLWVTSALRPQLDKAYADVVEKIAASIQVQ